MMRKRRFAYGAWLLFAILLYFFENNTGTRTILAASVFLPAASVLCAVRSARRVTVHLSAPDCCKQGDAAECSVRAEGLLPGAVLTAVLRGRSRLTGEETAVKLSVSRFAPDAAGTLRTAHCGTVMLSLSDAAVQDWFGLYRCALTVQSTRFVTVEPPLFDVRITLAENETVTADSERWSSTHPGHDPSETFGFRTYVPGDPIRQIHWKLSQKTDSLMVRELGLPVAEEVLLLLDTSTTGKEDAADALDAAMTALLSLSRSLTEQGIAHSVGWKNRELEELSLCTVQDQQDCTAVREQILTAAAAPDAESICDCFRKWSGDVYAHTVVCAPSLPRGLSLLQAGNRVTVLLSDGGAQSCGGVMVIPFSRKNMAQELEYLEI